MLYSFEGILKHNYDNETGETGLVTPPLTCWDTQYNYIFM